MTKEKELKPELNGMPIRLETNFEEYSRCAKASGSIYEKERCQASMAHNAEEDENTRLGLKPLLAVMIFFPCGLLLATLTFILEILTSFARRKWQERC